MEHHIEVAPSGRASCKTCGKSIGKGELRLGESVPSQFGSDGVQLRWHHLGCAARALPGPLAQALTGYAGEVPEREALLTAMKAGAEQPAPKRASGALPTADLAPTGRAKCIHCSEPIAKGSIRIAVEREVDTGAFVTKGAGYLHPACCAAWADSGWPAGLADLVSQVAGNTGLAVLPPPFADGVAAEPARPAAPAAAEPVVPGFADLPGKQVAAIVAKLAKLKDEYKADSVFEKAGLDWGSRDALRWHIARHGLLEPTHPTLLHRLAESAGSAGGDAVFAVLPRLNRASKDTVDLFPGWSRSADRIVLRAQELDPARLEALLADAGPLLHTGIQLVRGRCGATLPDAERQRVLTALAGGEAQGYGLPRAYGKDGARLYLQTLDASGALSEPYRNAIDLARVFGSDSDWARELAQKARAGKFTAIERVFEGLVILPLAELVALLAKPHFSSGEEHDRWVAKLVATRDNDPLALSRAALAIDREAYPGSYIREQLLIHAIGRIGERGQPLPEGLAAEAKWDGFQYCVAPWRGSSVLRAAYRKALAAVPREQALALARALLERSYGQSAALPFLSVHYDEALVRAIVATAADQGLSDPTAFAPLGAPAIPALLAALAEPGTGPAHDKRQAALGQCLRATLGFIGASGGEFDAALDCWLSCLPSESYWSEENRAIFLHMLAAMPEPRRIAALQRVLNETPQIERAFYGVRTTADRELRARAVRILVQKYGQVQDQHTLQVGLRELGEDGLSYFRPALRTEKPDTKIFTELRNVFGHAPVEALMKELNAVEEKPLARLFRLAGEYAGPKERIYLLERRDLDDTVPPARAGSFSWSRGPGPSQPAPTESAAAPAPGARAAPAPGTRPRRGSEHILTLDLEEIPELKPHFPDARAVSLFAPDPEHGDGWDKAELVAVPAGATAPSQRSPLTVMPIAVPAAIFDSSASREEPTLKEIRHLVFNRPGYVLGEPMFIQEDDGGGGDFIMQLAEQIGGLNLGDCGSLYVFASGSFMQCY